MSPCRHAGLDCALSYFFEDAEEPYAKFRRETHAKLLGQVPPAAAVGCKIARLALRQGR